MTLKEWKKEKGMTNAELVALFGFGSATISRYLSRKTIPTTLHMATIEDVTKKQVSLKDFINPPSCGK